MTEKINIPLVLSRLFPPSDPRYNGMRWGAGAQTIAANISLDKAYKIFIRNWPLVNTQNGINPPSLDAIVDEWNKILEEKPLEESKQCAYKSLIPFSDYEIPDDDLASGLLSFFFREENGSEEVRLKFRHPESDEIINLKIAEV